MIRSRVSVATLITLATIGTASAQPIDLLARSVVPSPPNNTAPAQPTRPTRFCLVTGSSKARNISGCRQR